MTTGRVYRSTAAPALRLRSLETLATPAPLLTVAVLILLLLLAAALGLRFIPWQQSVSGKGKVTVLSPMSRPQTIEAPITGRLVRWRVFEGQRVKAGDILADLEDLDSKFLDPQQPALLAGQRQALVERQVAIRQRIAELTIQADALAGSRSAAVPAAGQKARQAGDRQEAARQALTAARAAYTAADLNLKRLRELHDKGLRSRRDLELAELEATRTRTEIERAEATLAAAQRDVAVGELDQQKIAFDTQASLSSVRAALAGARESLASVESDLYKLDVELANTRLRVAQRQVRAPGDGVVVRLLTQGIGQTVKADDPLAQLIPAGAERAVELFLSDNDAPLVAPGRPVRVQFSGWPAVQFIGWPSVAVGTFAGKVAVVDAAGDGDGQVRVLVVPDPQTIRDREEQPWPDATLLRPGTGATGWILLDNVPLGFELWRQFNGFPPSIQAGTGPVKTKAK